MRISLKVSLHVTSPEFIIQIGRSLVKRHFLIHSRENAARVRLYGCFLI